MDIIRAIEQQQIKQDIPDFKVGDNVKVHYRIVEGCITSARRLARLRKSRRSRSAKANTSFAFIEKAPRGLFLYRGHGARARRGAEVRRRRLWA